MQNLRAFIPVVLFSLCVTQVFTAQVQNKLERIALIGTRDLPYEDQDDCSLAATDFFFGLLCNGLSLTMHLPKDLTSINKNDDLQWRRRLWYRDQPRLWAFSNTMFAMSIAQQYDIYLIDNMQSFEGKLYSRNRTAKFEPFLSSVTSGARESEHLYVQVYENTESQQFMGILHAFRYQNGKVTYEFDEKELSFSSKPHTILLKEFDNVYKLYRAMPDQHLALITVQKVINLSELAFQKAFSTSNNNCGSLLVVSAQYLVAACPQQGIITVYDNESYGELCSVQAPAGRFFKDQMVIYHHNNDQNTSSKIATIFVTGYTPSYNLHFVTQVHILPSKETEEVECVPELNDLLVAHTLQGHVQSQLQVGLSSSYLLVLLKTPGQIYTKDKRALYQSALGSFYQSSNSACPHHHFSTSVLKSGSCTSCQAQNLNPLEDAVKQAVCCSSPTEHGPYCQQCKQYKKRKGENPPQNAEWVNGEKCTTQCISGYEYVAASGRCELPLIHRMFKQDQCYSENTCKKCDPKSCYKDQCSPGELKRLEAMLFMNRQCGIDAHFCGARIRIIDLKDNPDSIYIQPNGEAGLTAKKGAFCEWLIEFINIPQSVTYQLRDTNQAVEICQIYLNGTLAFFDSNQEFNNTEEPYFNYFNIKIGALYYEDSTSDQMRIEISRKKDKEESSSAVIIGVVIGVVITLIIGGILAAWFVIRYKRVSYGKSQKKRMSAAAAAANNRTSAYEYKKSRKQHTKAPPI